VIKGLSARARGYIARAKRHGVEFEEIEPDDIFARDDLWCMEYPGKPCACAQRARTDVDTDHPDYATLGHFPAMTNGGPHFRANVFTQRWQCNAKQNAEVDQPTRAKWRRQARLTGPQSDQARAKKRPIPSRGFQGSRGLSSGQIKWKGRT